MRKSTAKPRPIRISDALQRSERPRRQGRNRYLKPLGRGFCDGGELPSGRTASKGDRGPDVRPGAVLAPGSVGDGARRCVCGGCGRARDPDCPHSLGGMLLGMALGTMLALPCTLVASQFLGMIEPMIPIMLDCMIAGMAAALADSRDAALGSAAAAGLGAVCGILACLSCSVADWLLRHRRGE